MEYEAVIGLEVHAQLKTKTKLFCSCSTEFGAEPNTHGCPVCLGLPGSLPVLNEEAVNYAIKMALATNCRINETSIFARKNYFYPDLPKGYQISQYDKPLAEEGFVEFYVDGEKKRVRLIRIHIEEDAGKLKHEGSDGSLFDVNRAGTPLIEIVSYPDIRTPKEASEYMKKLRQILLYLGISDGNMEEGSLRCDANISVRPKGTDKLGTKTELKNLNSFRNLEKAIEYEIERQISLIENGEKVVQETRLWDPVKNVTRAMRSKEEAHDYRYFPEPDLVPLVVNEEWISNIKETIEELPNEKIERFMKDYNLSYYEANLLCETKERANYYEEVIKIHPDYKQVANWMLVEVYRYLNDNNIEIKDFPIKPEDLGELLKFIKDGKITNNIGKKVFQKMIETGKKAAQIIEEEGLVQISDTSELDAIADEIIKNSPKQVEKYLKGNEKVLGYFIGQLMRETKGKANPQIANQLFKKKLEELKNNG